MDVDPIRERLMRARRRVAGATPGSPEWDAAMDEVESLEAQAARAEAHPADDPGSAVRIPALRIVA